VEAEDLLVGTDRWRMASLAVECDGSVTMSVVPNSATAICPVCSTPSGRKHTWYQRTAMDLPWRKRTVRLRVWARRFFCDEPTCPRKIFAERFAGLLRRYGRRTEEATRLLLAFAQRAGGEAGARLAHEAGLPTSPDTLRRLLRGQCFDFETVPSVLGVDEFSLRRPKRYGLLLVDLERRRPIDVLGDDEPATLAGWLRAHPGAQVIARDRGHKIKEGVKLGAPTVVHVTDRFHLLRNVVDALDELQQQRRRAGSEAFRDAAHSLRVAEAPLPTGPPPEPELVGIRPPSPDNARRREERLARWQRAQVLRQSGRSMGAIAADLGITRQTVRGLLAAAAAPRNQQGTHPPRLLEPFLPYLRQRWSDGFQTATLLTREIEALGYRGSGSTVRGTLARWRLPRAPRSGRSPRQHVRWLLIRAPDQLKEKERIDVQRVLAADALLAQGYDLVQRFRILLHELDVTGFDRWLTDATASNLASFVSVAGGMTSDLVAIRNAFRYSWSTGPVEGHINRVKLIKRAGYGRAKLPLLRARILGRN
jgi:transposase